MSWFNGRPPLLPLTARPFPTHYPYYPYSLAFPLPNAIATAGSAPTTSTPAAGTTANTTLIAPRQTNIVGSSNEGRKTNSEKLEPNETTVADSASVPVKKPPNKKPKLPPPEEIDPQRDRWEVMFEKLQAHREKTGDCRIRNSERERDPELRRLYRWTATQRENYRKSDSLLHRQPERIKMLNDIGFSWNVIHDFWHKKYKSLLEFKAKFGHCNVSGKNSEWSELGVWVEVQRREYAIFRSGAPGPTGKASSLTSERIRLLEEAGFEFNRSDKYWKEMYDILVSFFKVNGHCDVPDDYPNADLVKWISHQRHSYKLSKERNQKTLFSNNKAVMLEDVGFVFDIKPKAASKKEGRKPTEVGTNDEEINDAGKADNENVEEQQEAGEDVATTNVTKVDEKHKSHKTCSDSENEEDEEGNSIRDKQWPKRFLEVVRFVQKQGSFDLAQLHKENPRLYEWVKIQKKECTTCVSTYKFIFKNRQRLLSEIGVEFPPHVPEKYRKRSDICKEAVLESHSGYRDDLNERQSQAKTDVAEAEKAIEEAVRALDEAKGRLSDINSEIEEYETAMGEAEEEGFDRWDEMFTKLKAFFDEHGHCQVRFPRKEPNTELQSLYKWTVRQQKSFRTAQSNRSPLWRFPHRIRLLQWMGFSWNRLEDTWRNKYERLLEFKAQHGHCNASSKNPAWRELGLWIEVQRKEFALIRANPDRVTNLTPERIQLLEEAGFEFNRGDKYWREMYALLVTYTKENGHCLVPNDHENADLVKWVGHQRHLHKLAKDGVRNIYSQDKSIMLEDIGFKFDPLSEQDKQDCETDEAHGYWGRQWGKRFQDLLHYVTDDGSCQIQRLSEENPQLNSWADKQLRQYASRDGNSLIGKNRKKLLEDIGLSVPDAMNTAAEEDLAKSGNNEHFH